jgi:hypothetical protein
MRKIILLSGIFIASITAVNADFLDYQSFGGANQDVSIDGPGNNFSKGVAAYYNIGKIFHLSPVRGAFGGKFGAEFEITKGIVLPKIDTSTTEATFDLTTLAGYATYRHMFNKAFFMAIKAGYHKSDSKIECDKGCGDSTESENGLTHGVMFGFNIDRKIALTARHTTYKFDNADITLLGAGIRLTF